MIEKEDVSNWWYLVPILFGLLGGIIAYGSISSKDQAKADSMLFLGGMVTFFLFLLTWALLR